MAAQNIFNLYSSSVFADHPLALWNLDDDFSYVGLTAPWPAFASGESLYSDDQLVITNGQEYNVSNKNSIIWITRDGQYNESANQTIFDIAYANGIWIAVGTNEGFSGSRRSTDAVTWTTINTNYGSSIFSIDYGNNIWLIGGIDLPALRYSTDSINWTTVTSTSNDTTLSVAYGNGIWAYAPSSYIKTSTDIISWTTRYPKVYSNVQIIAYENNLWFAGGNYGEISTSTDSISWITRNSNFIQSLNNRPVSITYGNNVWLLTSNSGEIQTSTNTISWVTRKILNDSSILAGKAAYGNGKWVVNANNGSYGSPYITFSSTDSITWQTSSGAPTYLWSIAYGNNFWVASPGKAFYQSFSGEDLIIKTNPAETVGISDSDFYFASFAVVEPNATIKGLSHDPRKDIDTSKDSLNLNVFTYDYDGNISSYELGLEHYLTWTTINPNSSISGVYDIAYGNGVWVAGGGSFANTTPLYAPIALRPLTEMTVSTNGLNWVTRSYAGTPRYSFTDNNAGIVFSNIAYGNGIWAAQGKYFFDSGAPSQSNRIYSSTDTINWVSKNNPLNGIAAINSLEYGNNTWIAGGSYGKLISSTDLVNWVTRTSNFDNDSIRGINYNNIWVMVGDRAQIRTSTNAINWVTRNSNINDSSNNIFSKVAYGNNIWIAVGTYLGSQSLMSAYSTDAISWVAGNFYPSSSGDVGIAYGNGVWVVGSANGGMYVSTNGISWVTSISNFGNNNIKVIQYNNGLWIAGGQSGQIRYSTDTVSWITANSHFGRTHISQSIYDYTTINETTEDSWQKNTYITNSDSWSASANLYPNLIDAISFPYLKMTVSENTNAAIVSLYNFSLGQWSEQYNIESSGARTIPLSSSDIISSVSSVYSASTSLFSYVPADAYSLSDSDNGYYMLENAKPLALNTKLPMVYGSGNITEIYPSSYGAPSIIIPGKGFFHQTGKYSQLTLEFWMRVNVNTKTPTKIVGPVASDDGLYVHDGFITLNVGPYQRSYFISHWYRPCLIDITYTQNSSTVMINGQTVINITLDSNEVSFPESTSFNNDWIAFYATEYTQPFEIDCIAVYPYIVPEDLAKRRFAFGQAVGKSSDIVERFGGSLTNIDFAFANYTNHTKYPDLTQWRSGFYSNLNADSKFLALPQYSLPEINYSGDNLTIFNNGSNVLKDSLNLQISTSNLGCISLKPTSTYQNVYGAISFPSMKILNDEIRSIFGIFSINSTELASANADANITELTIMYFKNNSTGDVFKIYIDLSTNKLVYKFNTTLIEEFSLTITSSDLVFIAGIDIEVLSDAYSAIIRRFFYDLNNVTFNIGGYEKNMFTGKIHKLTLNNAFFTRIDTDTWFNANGLASISNSVVTTINSAASTYIGNYSLVFKKANTSMIMDIASRGYWEDSIPLTFFGSYVKDIDGNNSIYKLDLMQFNIDYPTSIYSNETINTDNDLVKSFITLKTYEDVGNVLYSNYTVTETLGNEKVIDFDNVSGNIDITKFVVVDGTTIFAPRNLIDFKDTYITIHLELINYGNATEPTVLKELAIASLAYDQVDLFPINSFNGNKAYPFYREGLIYTNKINNPIAIDRYSMPYLFLTSDSGIYATPYAEIDNSLPELSGRGITFPINTKSLADYDMYGFHAWICYKKEDTFSATTKIMTLKSETLTLNFYLNSENNGERATVSVKTQTIAGEQDYTNIVMYQDGVELETPYIRPMSWTFLTFRFITPVQFDSYIGQLEINPGLLINNVAIYNQDINTKVDDIFETHLGLSNIVIQDNSSLLVNFDSLVLYTDIKEAIYIGKAV